MSALARAIWAGDVGTLERLAPCRCCCHEHTFVNCDAREWGGCRSGLAPGEESDDVAWARHYERFHGMPPEVFYGLDDTSANEDADLGT